jgi:hypothetical protein
VGTPRRRESDGGADRPAPTEAQCRGADRECRGSDRTARPRARCPLPAGGAIFRSGTGRTVRPAAILGRARRPCVAKQLNPELCSRCVATSRGCALCADRLHLPRTMQRQCAATPRPRTHVVRPVTARDHLLHGLRQRRDASQHRVGPAHPLLTGNPACQTRCPCRSTKRAPIPRPRRWRRACP